MPPKIRFDREHILDAAFALVREKGAEALNARALAQRLGCSTQPIYRAFENMEDIRAQVGARAYALYEQRLFSSADTAKTPYLGSGLSYLRFADEEKELFRLLFMRDRSQEIPASQAPDSAMRYAAQLLTQRFGFTTEEALRFHRHIYIFTHGLASMIATRFIPYDEASLVAHLHDELTALLALYGKTL